MFILHDSTSCVLYLFSLFILSCQEKAVEKYDAVVVLENGGIGHTDSMSCVDICIL